VLAIEDDEKASDTNVRGNAFFMKEPVSQVDPQLIVLDSGWGLRHPQRDSGYRKVQQMLAYCPEQELSDLVVGARACQPLVDVGSAEPGQTASRPGPGHQVNRGA